ncbi:hypothetical protein EJB05_13415, partial [Eragrostis curvula]
MERLPLGGEFLKHAPLGSLHPRRLWSARCEEPARCALVGIIRRPLHILSDYMACFITPFICKIVGDSVYDARKAILIGGSVPLAMVLSWNAVILGLASAGGNAAFDDPIKLLLSVNPAALPAVRGFAFAALATNLIGYAVSFPKQLSDTVDLIVQRSPDSHEDILPGGNAALLILFCTAVVLAFWH